MTGVMMASAAAQAAAVGGSNIILTAWTSYSTTSGPAGITVGTNATMVRTRNGTSTQMYPLTDWLVPTPPGYSGANYECRIVNVVWSTGISWYQEAEVEDVWIDLSIGRTWSVRDTSSTAVGVRSVAFDLEIGLVGQSTALASASYTLNADWEIFGGGGCFGPNTIVLMEDNTEKLLRDLVDGDVLKSYSVPNRIDESDPTWYTWEEPEVDSGTITTSTVINGVVEYLQGIYYVINNGLEVTNDHRLLVYRSSTSSWMWVRPADISVGDMLYNSDKDDIAVTSIDLVVENINTYNINVEDIDTFYVKVAGEFIVVHNKIAIP